MALSKITADSLGANAVTANAISNTAIIAAVGYTPANKAGDTFTGNVVFSANATITGAAAFSNNVTITGNTTFSNTVAITGNATFSNTVAIGGDFISPHTGFKNRVINGAMVIDQRNAGTVYTSPASNAYTLDRFQTFGGNSLTFNVQRNAGSVTPPVGFTNYLGVTSTAASTISAGSNARMMHRIEGYNLADLSWGTANAKAVTISFWVRSSLTGTFGFSMWNANGDVSFPGSYVINSANTWEFKTIAVAGPTSGTFETTDAVGVNLNFSLGAGSTYTGGTANAWNAGLYFQPTGSVNLTATNGATLYVTGLQFERGSAATAFDYRDYGRELIMCQRYYEIIKSVSGIGYASASVFDGLALGANFRVEKRATPTVTRVSGTAINRTSGAVGSNTGTPDNVTQYGFSIIMQSQSGAGIVQWQSGVYTADSELG